MAEPAKQFEIITSNSDEPLKKLKDTILETHTEELIIGLCGPIGTDIHFVSGALKKIIEEQFNYECHIIKLSKLITTYTEEKLKISAIKDEYKRIKTLIEGGNFLREQHTNDILAELAINEIAVLREEKQKEKESAGNESDYKGIRACFIIDSFKSIEELNLFKLIYRELFYSIGVFSPFDIRKQNLLNRGLTEENIVELINQDSGEEKDSGQKVADTFINCDFFLRFENSSFNVIENKIKRYLHLIFSSDIVTPTANETAMYVAASAAGNSACLSRQVGASITDEKGEILGVGWNDVPKAGGSVYQSDEIDPLGKNDHRCMNRSGGKCFNDHEKTFIAETLIDEMIGAGLAENSNRTQLITLVKKKSKIKDLIEFSRAVHAEMLAIILASQKAGGRIINGKLFCTTYPCHNCARHIIAAGIKEVYYIEPYRKSLAIKLHGDSITEEETKNQLVRILMFEGVAPSRYLDFFQMIPGSRKNNGLKITSSTKTIKPKNTLSLQAIPILEKKVTESLHKKNLIK